MDIGVKTLWVLNIAGIEIWITETIVNTWIIMFFLMALALIVRIRLRRFQEIPTGFQNAVEAVVEAFDSFAASTLGEKFSYLFPWFFMAFAFILSSSLFSIVGLRAPTADWTTTAALALATFMFMFLLGIKYRKGSYLKSLIEPHPVFFPMNVLGELAKPVALSFRLFGNVLSGTIILTLYYALTPLFVQFGPPALLHGFFDVLFGGLQTYIFVIISLMYIKIAADSEW
ncbi:MAG: F0F1 ATP synthase subunit A [Firmicutes bacterium]|nr:F0F1 ATP synthase subunit A [Bacillota bacterium]